MDKWTRGWIPSRLWKTYCDPGTALGIGETATSHTLKPLPSQSCRATDDKWINNNVPRALVRGMGRKIPVRGAVLDSHWEMMLEYRQHPSR